MKHFGPQLEQYGALQHEPVPVRRDAEPVEQPFDGEFREQELELRLAQAREIQEAGADRCRNVRGLPYWRHPRASR